VHLNLPACSQPSHNCHWVSLCVEQQVQAIPKHLLQSTNVIDTLEICTQKTLGTVNPHSYIGDMLQVQLYLGFTNPCIILSKCLWLKVVSLQPSAMLPNVYNMAEAHQPLHAFRTVDPLVFLLLLGNFFGCCKVILPASASILKSVSKVCSPLTVPGGLQHWHGGIWPLALEILPRVVGAVTPLLSG